MKWKTCFSLSFLLVCFHPTHQLSFVPEALRPSIGDALEAIFGMGIRLQVLLPSDKSDNFLVSPISASLVIGQMMLGAEGEFQEQLFELLSLPKSDNVNAVKIYSSNGQNATYANSYFNLHLQMNNLMRELRKSLSPRSQYTLQISNAIFVSDSLLLNRQFEHESDLMYDAEIHRVNFQKSFDSMNYINKWASDHTRGLIKEIIQTPPMPTTAGIFANAIYFLGEWEQPFSHELNTVGVFHVNPQKTEKVSFMMGSMEQIPYSESKILNCKMVVLPYKDRELGMYMILPNKGHKHEFNLKAFAQDMHAAHMLEMIENLKNRDVTVKIPKLNLSSSLSILKPLQKYALYKKVSKELPSPGGALDVLQHKIEVYERFKNSVNNNDIVLTAAAPGGTFRIADILQEMTFAVNEKGTEAAAVAAGIIDYNGGAKSFLGNKPFMFFIRHEATGATLFWGAINNPNA